MKIALGQINPTVGDFCGNAAKIISYTREAQQRGADLILFPELAICGYPPRDLVETILCYTQRRDAWPNCPRDPGNFRYLRARHAGEERNRKICDEFRCLAVRWPRGVHAIEDVTADL